MHSLFVKFSSVSGTKLRFGDAQAELGPRECRGPLHAVWETGSEQRNAQHGTGVLMRALREAMRRCGWKDTAGKNHREQHVQRVSRGTDLRELEGHQLRSGQQDGTQ